MTLDTEKMKALADQLERTWNLEGATAIRELLAALEAAAADKRDAERYRLIRSYYTRVVFMQEDGPEIDLWAVGEIGDAYEMQVLDQAVDAALSQRQEES